MFSCKLVFIAKVIWDLQESSDKCSVIDVCHQLNYLIHSRNKKFLVITFVFAGNMT